jgi:orotidine-5'-phosphate decarboxylase
VIQVFNHLDIEAVYDKIIWSADIDSLGPFWDTVNRMPKLRIIKLDRLFVARHGHGVIDQLNQRGLKVFDDAKLVEIPSKLVALAELELQHHPWMLNCVAGCESSGILEDPDPEKVEALKRFADACHQVGTRPCGVTVLTSKQPNVVEAEFGGRTSIEQVLHYVEVLQQCGFTDIVCSPEELPAIRAESRFDELGTNTPGVRPAGSAIGDQARTNTPEGALAAGATRLVIGRPLTNGDPAENLDNIVNGILAA